jgi:general secretion pathway protein J
MRARGFTLIEVMVAVAILAIVTTLTWASFRQSFATKSQIEAQAGRYRTVRLALDRLAREISMAYISQNEDSSQQPDRRTRLVGKRHTDVDEIMFTYFGHQRLYQDANECDTAMVAYYSARDRNDSRKINLMRRETRRLPYFKLIDDQAGETDIVCDDVVRLKIDYWDVRDKTWREEWTTAQSDGQASRLPGKVRITLTVHDERGVEVPFQTMVRIAMSEPLDNQPKDLVVTGPGQMPQQQAGSGGTGATGGAGGSVGPR